MFCLLTFTALKMLSFSVFFLNERQSGPLFSFWILLGLVRKMATRKTPLNLQLLQLFKILAGCDGNIVHNPNMIWSSIFLRPNWQTRQFVQIFLSSKRGAAGSWHHSVAQLRRPETSILPTRLPLCAGVLSRTSRSCIPSPTLHNPPRVAPHTRGRSQASPGPADMGDAARTGSRRIGLERRREETGARPAARSGSAGRARLLADEVVGLGVGDSDLPGPNSRGFTGHESPAPPPPPPPPDGNRAERRSRAAELRRSGAGSPALAEKTAALYKVPAGGCRRR